MHTFRPLVRLVPALILAGGFFALSACGGSKASPSGPSAIPTATPTPTAPPAAPPASALSACDRLEKVTQKSACNEGSGSLTSEVSDAIDRVIGSRPDLFEMTATNNAGDPHILKQDAYYQAVIAELDKADICAARVGPSELDIEVTNNYNFSDRFTIMTGYAYPRRGKASYVHTCTPASLPKVEITAVDWIYVTAYGPLCPAGAVLENPFVKGDKAEIPFQCEVSVTATPKTWGGLDVPEAVHGSQVEWTQVTGEFIFWEWADNHFNVTLSPRAVGPVKLCATVQGVTGCLNATIVP